MATGIDNLSVCGVRCNECAYYGDSCKGCGAIEGKVFWTCYVGCDVCPTYSCCASQKQLKHCGECAQLPCRLYFDEKDPAHTDEEFLMGIEDRIKNLR